MNFSVINTKKEHERNSQKNFQTRFQINKSEIDEFYKDYEILKRKFLKKTKNNNNFKRKIVMNPLRLEIKKPS